MQVQLLDRRAGRRPGADQVVDDRDPSPGGGRAKRLGKPVSGSQESSTLGQWQPFSEKELDIELEGDELSDQCSADQGPTDRVRFELSQLGREGRSEGPQTRGAQKQGLEVHPAVTVVAGLEMEMSFSRLQQRAEIAVYEPLRRERWNLRMPPSQRP